MTDSCRYCVAPERYPGCHDHCDKLKAHRESDEYKKLCEYKNTYLKSHSTASSSQINKAMRYFKYKGYGHPEIDVDVYYEYDAGDNSWWHFCDARDNASGDKILGVCNPNVWSIDAIEESVKYLFSKMNIGIKQNRGFKNEKL